MGTFAEEQMSFKETNFRFPFPFAADKRKLPVSVRFVSVYILVSPFPVYIYIYIYMENGTYGSIYINKVSVSVFRSFRFPYICLHTLVPFPVYIFTENVRTETATCVCLLQRKMETDTFYMYTNCICCRFSTNQT
jgi:hypothetical protein